MAPPVIEAMRSAAQSNVDMTELHEAAGRYLARLVGVEAVHITACATAGISLMAAACMTGCDRSKAQRLPDTRGMPARFVVQRAHRTPFDRAVLLTGARFLEVKPDRSELRAALSNGAAGVYHTFAWFCDGEALPLPVVCSEAHAAGLPVIVDAAAELPPVENLRRFLQMGADLVTFSGGKALAGPQSSGLVLGREALVAACALNDAPNMAIGRGMKAGKEEISGLVEAVEAYLGRDHPAERREWDRRIEVIRRRLASIPGLTLRRQLPFGPGQQVPHLAVMVDSVSPSGALAEAADRLYRGSPRVAVQLHTPDGEEYNVSLGPQLRVHPHSLRPGEETIVAERMARVLTDLSRGKRPHESL